MSASQLSWLARSKLLSAARAASPQAQGLPLSPRQTDSRAGPVMPINRSDSSVLPNVWPSMISNGGESGIPSRVTGTGGATRSVMRGSVRFLPSKRSTALISTGSARATEALAMGCTEGRKVSSRPTERTQQTNSEIVRNSGDVRPAFARLIATRSRCRTHRAGSSKPSVSGAPLSVKRCRERPRATVLLLNCPANADLYIEIGCDATAHRLPIRNICKRRLYRERVDPIQQSLPAFHGRLVCSRHELRGT